MMCPREARQASNPQHRHKPYAVELALTGRQSLTLRQLRERYLWGPAVDQILAEEAVNGGTADLVHLVQWTLVDHLNTVRDVSRFDPETGATTVVNHLVYDAFGRVTSESNPAVDSLFLFTARPFDADTGLQNNLNRWYDARVGRWLSEDPLQADQNLYRYSENDPLVLVDPAGLIAVTRKGPHYGTGSPLPTSTANNIAVFYEFSHWGISDLPGMVQRVTDEGTFSFSGDRVGGTLRWKETYDEGWVRGITDREYSFIDRHIAGPSEAAHAVEQFFHTSFGRERNNTLYLGDWQICSWDFTLIATFEMRNAWRNDWVGLNLYQVTFGGAGNLKWEINLTAYAVGGPGVVAWFEENQNNGGLYGFGSFLFPNQGIAPPLGFWVFGRYHAISQETWRVSWKSGEAQPTMTYEGGYNVE